MSFVEIISQITNRGIKAMNNDRQFIQRKFEKSKLLRVSTDLAENIRVSQKLHEDIGSMLAALKIYARIIQKDNKNNIETHAKWNELNLLIDKILENVQQLATDIFPYLLEKSGLINALEHRINNIEKNIIFSHNVQRKLILNKEVMVYKIINSLFEISKDYYLCTIINLSLNQSGNKLNIDYFDNGPSLYELKKSNKADYKLIVTSLKEIEERVNILNGNQFFLLCQKNSLHLKMEIPI